MKQCFILLILLAICKQTIAAEDYYTFNSNEQQQRFALLTSQLRCLVCQNQTLAESNAPLAVNFRNQIYEKIMSGQSDKSITEYLVSRYGNFILYQPPFDKSTIVLWCGPFVMLFLGVIFLFYSIRKSKP